MVSDNDGLSVADSCAEDPSGERDIFSVMADRTGLILFIIVLLAFLFRSIPAWTNAAWGNEIGIYYGLTHSFVKYGTLFNTYDGWGGSYNYFPVLYVVGGTVHLITGASIIKSLTYTAPVFGAATSLILYYITYDLFHDRRIALLAAAFLAVNPIHLYQTSHAAPLTMGHFFMLLSVLFFLKFRRRKRYFLLLTISSGLLIMSHHLTTFIYIISLIGIIFTGNLLSPQFRKRLYLEIMYLMAFSAAAFSYWLLIAGKHFNSFFKAGTSMTPKIMILVFYIALILLLLFTNILRKRVSKLYFPVYEGRYDSRIGLVTMCFLLVLMIAGTFFITIPGTTTNLNWEVVLVSIPLICIIAFVIMGFPYLSGMKVRPVLSGWIGAILFSMIVAFATQNRVLFPNRHFEYLMEPISIIAAIGAYKYYHHGMIYRNEGLGSELKITKPRMLIKYPSTFRRLCLALIILVLISNGISSFPMRNPSGRYVEKYTDQDIAAVEWLMENVDINLTIATDRRLGQMVHGMGNFKNVTYGDEIFWLWYHTDWESCERELNTTNITDLPPISYVMIDDIMYEKGVRAEALVEPRPMTPESYAKFSAYPFERVYRNETRDQKEWAEVYMVDW